MTRPVGRPSKTKVKRFYEDFQYQAQSWDKPCRVIAKIEWHPGELFPRVGFILTNLPMEPDWVVRFYNQRGTAEQPIKDRQIRLQLDAAVVQAVPRQGGPAAPARADLQPGHIPALHRTTRGNGPMVADQPTAQADQDRGPHGTSRPCDHLPTGRGRSHRPDGEGHSRCHTQIASATDISVTAVQTCPAKKGTNQK